MTDERILCAAIWYKDFPRTVSHYMCINIEKGVVLCLIINDELNRETCNKIEELYVNAGWRFAKCLTSSENDERPGLTQLTLLTN